MASGSLASGDHGRWGRRLAGIVVIVASGLWLLLLATVVLALWGLAGAEGVTALTLEPWFLAPVAIGLAMLAFGIRTAAPRPSAPSLGELAPARPAGHSTARVVGIAALVVAAVAGLEWAVTTRAEGPYPFADVPKGDLIAYSAPDGIRLVQADGGTSWLVPGTGDMSGPVWAPDGQGLAAVDLWNCCGAYRFAVDGSSRTRLPANSDTTPVWSPDGRRLVVVRLDAGGPRIVIRRVARAGPEVVLPRGGNEPAWSPDGRLIAFQSRGRGDVLQIYVVRPDGSGLRALTTEAARDIDGATGAAWSPDGRRIAFEADFDGDEDIYVIALDGTGLRKIVESPLDEMGPTWSPDGRRVAFGRMTAHLENATIVVRDLASGAETVIAHGDIVFEPAWQPGRGR